MSRRRRVFLVLAVLWMSLIFFMSSRPGEESSKDSSWAGWMIGETFVPGFDDWSEDEQEEFVERIDHPVRKTAHATEYAVLGLLTAGALIDRKGKICGIWSGVFIPCGIAALYAATDEFHQLFVPGRSGQILDVCIDSGGAFAALLVLALIRCCSARRKENCIDKKTEYGRKFC